ncbi:helix-turn-helix domain-containing protein [Bosea sp. BH3]|uniref:helix-turn-helix domain-containing protein n=1 Tax=Bosea sp. BH3 TaxID=2871701 RepID=UPI0021CB71CD|nr:helix-turn-helix domain-containing protein [Bosea sp. BH3]MCU4181775.1 helix-turn-helix domain-containing protein [Bosea sp. BH3]
MHLVTTREAIRLTGLSTATLREWTSRRALIPADVPPKNQGSPARYGWQTILLLRLAVTLRDRFHLELQAHRGLFADLKLGLARASFIALWGKALVLQGGDRWSLLDEGNPASLHEDGIVIRLQTHLEALSCGFAFSGPTSPPGQLELFPGQAVDASLPRTLKVVPAHPLVAKRRRSA